MHRYWYASANLKIDLVQHMVAETSYMLIDTSVHDVRYLTQYMYVVTNTLCCSDKVVPQYNISDTSVHGSYCIIQGDNARLPVREYTVTFYGT